MSTKAYLSFTEFTPLQPYAFVNAEAWNSYWRTVYVELSGVTLPQATLTVNGAVKAFNLYQWNFSGGLASMNYFNLTDTSGNSVFVPSKESFDKFIYEFSSMAANYIELIKQLKNAGIHL